MQKSADGIVGAARTEGLWPRYWNEDERAEFAAFIALDPEAGSDIRGSGGVRKVRWAREGTGKSDGVRIVASL